MAGVLCEYVTQCDVKLESICADGNIVLILSQTVVRQVSKPTGGFERFAVDKVLDKTVSPQSVYRLA